MNVLKSHPFAVEAFFESSVVLTFAIPKKELEPLIPQGLELDTYDDQWGFIAVAMVDTKNLRPKGFPKWMGNDFFLCGYRIFVKYYHPKGKRLRGLYILKSETDQKKMKVLGNLMTHYNYSKIDIKNEKKGDFRLIESQKGGFKVEINDAIKNVDLPSQSPFTDWKNARRFAGPLPFTFTVLTKEKKVLIIEGVRKNWKPTPIEISNAQFKFLSDFQFSEIYLASAFEIKNVPYFWKKGQIETWH